jgi:AcrR family transcriptional regulator
MERVDAVVTPLHATRSGMRTSGDPRVARTRQAILDAVATLAAHDKAISVSAIVRAAGIARSSFYTHFSGVDELAVTVLNGVFDAIGTEDIELRRHKVVSGAEAARHAQVRLVGHLAQHRALYASMLALPVTSAVYARAVETMPEGLSATAVSIYTASGSLGLLAHWVLSEDPMPTDVMVEQLMALLPSWLATP